MLIKNKSLKVDKKFFEDILSSADKKDDKCILKSIEYCSSLFTETSFVEYKMLTKISKEREKVIRLLFNEGKVEEGSLPNFIDPNFIDKNVIYSIISDIAQLLVEAKRAKQNELV